MSVYENCVPCDKLCKMQIKIQYNSSWYWIKDTLKYGIAGSIELLIWKFLVSMKNSSTASSYSIHITLVNLCIHRLSQKIWYDFPRINIWVCCAKSIYTTSWTKVSALGSFISPKRNWIRRGKMKKKNSQNIRPKLWFIILPSSSSLYCTAENPNSVFHEFT